MNNYDINANVSIHPTLKKIIEQDEKAREKDQKPKLLYDDEAREKDQKHKLLYDDESSDCCIPDLNSARKNCTFSRDVDVFALWRKLASVKVDQSLDPQICPTKDLMNYILLKLNKSFPKLELSWSEESWNPSLIINGCLTKVSMEKISLAYQGLLNISEELNAQTIICNIITKKLEELFI